MFRKISDLFSNFFGSLFGGKTPPAPSPSPTRPKVHDKPTNAVEDSSDVPVDTIRTVEIVDVDIPQGTGPFVDDDKGGAFEDGNGGGKPAPKPADPPVVVDKPKPADPAPPKPPTPKPPTPPAPPATKHTPRYLWCLDNGHGKLQPGKRSPKYLDNEKETQFFEYEFNRDIVERIIYQLDEKGVKYYDIVPDYLEVGSFLEERVERANKKKSDLDRIYVSVHANAGPAPTENDWTPDTVKGVETWYAQNSTKGKKIAAIFQKHILAKTGLKDRKLRSTDEKALYVLTKTVMPAILTENGFFNNKVEVKELMKSSMRQKIADAHVAAIMEIEKNGI